MVVQDKSKYKSILDTFKKACYDLGKKVFGVEKPVEILVKEKDIRKYLTMKIAPIAYYKDGKIYLTSPLLDLIIDNYKKPEVIERVLGILVHEYVHHLLDLKKIAGNRLRHIDEGIAEAIKIFYSKIVRKCSNRNIRSLDEIIACSNDEFLNISNNQSEIYEISREIDLEYQKVLKNLEESIQNALKYCSDRAEGSLREFSQILEYIKALDQTLELIYNALYLMAGYTILRKRGIKKLVKDISKISRRKNINKILKEYENILFEEFEKLESEGYKILEAVNCLEIKKEELLDMISNLDRFINALISSIEKRIKEQEERLRKFKEE